MKNIHDASAYQEIVERIKLLSASHSPRWGKMSLPEMLAHCTVQLKMAVGEVSAPPQGSTFLRTALGKWIALGDIPWPKGAQTPNEMNMHRNKVIPLDIENAKNELLTYLKKINDLSSLSPHPFFGALSQTEWGKLIYKHLDHHLRQFGN